MGGARSTYRERRGVYGVLAGRLEGKGQLGRLEVGWGGMNWFDLAQDRDKWRPFVDAVMNLRVS